jgi:hypothetical protein
LELAEELAKTCYEMYEVTQTGLAPEIAYFNLYVSDIFTNPSPINSFLCILLSGLVSSDSKMAKGQTVVLECPEIGEVFCCRLKMLLWREERQIQCTSMTSASDLQIVTTFFAQKQSSPFSYFTESLRIPGLWNSNYSFFSSL